MYVGIYEYIDICGSMNHLLKTNVEYDKSKYIHVYSPWSYDNPWFSIVIYSKYMTILCYI